MSWILEKPWHVATIGGLFTVATAYLALKFPERRRIWWIPSGIAVLTLLLTILGLTIVTEAEQVKRTLFAAKRAVERGDLDDFVSYIHPDAKDLQRMARGEVERYKIRVVSIKSNLKITVDESRKPPRAFVTFNVVVQGSDPDSLIGTRNVPRFIEMEFEKVGSEWKAVKFQHFDPLRSMRTDDYKRSHSDRVLPLP